MAEKDKTKKKAKTTKATKTKSAKAKPTKVKPAKAKSSKAKSAKPKSAKVKSAKPRSSKSKAATKKSPTPKKSAAKKPASKKTAARSSTRKSPTKASQPAKPKVKKEIKPRVKGTAAAPSAKPRSTKGKSKKDMKTLRRKSGNLVEEDKIAGVGDKTVQAKTGNTWSEWFTIIDKAGGKDFDHRSIARYLYDSHPDLSSWWSQMITVGYEQTRGKRDKYQRMEGYAVNASKTISAPVADVYSAWTSAAKRAKWLPRVKFKIATKHENKTLRLEWMDKITRVEVHFYERGMGRSQITVQHRKLPNSDKADEMRTYWRERLAVLANQIKTS